MKKKEKLQAYNTHLPAVGTNQVKCQCRNGATSDWPRWCIGYCKSKHIATSNICATW